ncbi:hypothetical protein Kpol_2002p17 [Vanderwaltozyma polyspora DSM 70294]|uniref:Protein PBN1 n=1 Tax=Vanderwaltozyma polyspora (strain ATCC 22028 / DSM 70294 / BCRC 21397 / CBS 2163 / NBRC 10782 / NRRL Y-8283 / UCD 57-17) TaxID=436907 RepID=A7TFD3_VANPO|nr:uncharacterized protein Kpol_2002p17 [Vanderwaltozyma polyspora DSM 70294]EDO18947.1 hypothetical protein Kpol_2002p17 [Vanderwaltozyma polyspora DSM 70294]
MAFKGRLAALYGSLDEINEKLSINDTHIVLSGGDGVVLQQRWIGSVDVDGVDLDFQGRITWRGPDTHCIDESNVIEPKLAKGLTVYVDRNSGGKSERSSGGLKGYPLVDSVVYKSYHEDGEEFRIKDFLPDSVDLGFVDWDKSKDYDISITNSTIQIVEYSRLIGNDTFTYGKLSGTDKVEAGLFYADAQDEQDINLTGVRCTWDDDDNQLEGCQKTMLFYNPAHINLADKIGDDTNQQILDIESPIGLHPKLLIDLRNQTNSGKNCKYFLYSQLPLQLFVDKFQSDPVVLFGEHDLELPDYKLKSSWGSEVLFALENDKLNEITLHSRYVEPVEGGGYLNVGFNPAVFLACDSGNDNIKQNPFYSKGLGFESFFTDDTIFKHIANKDITVPIPRPDTEVYQTVTTITSVCLIVSMIYLFRKLFGRVEPSVKSETKENSEK